MSTLVLGPNCEPAGRPILGGMFGVTPEPSHVCPGEWNMMPGRMGGEQCSCACHLRRAAPAPTES